MSEREIAVVISYDNDGVNALETIDAVKESGFKNVFIQWYDKDWEISQEKQFKYMKDNGLNVIFAHLGYQKINTIWEETEDGEAHVSRFCKDLDDCKKNGIGLVVMHLCSKSTAPGPNEIGLNRLKKICDHALGLGIKIAFENTKIKGYQEYIIDNIDNDNVGICLDVGHAHAHFNDEFDFDRFKDKIFAVHLHDNDGTADQHLLPFDGTIDWSYYIDGLKRANYKGPVTLELCYRGDYLNMGVQKYYQKGYEIGLELKKMLKE